jgi:hypothetical protein
VGPNPLALPNGDQDGQLEVFSAKEGRIEGDNPTWFQHSDYYIYTQERKSIKRVNNTIGYYEQAPRRITLPAGTYLVKAHAKDHFWVEVPVIIRSGLLTVVHLDQSSTPQAGKPETQ